MRIPSNYTEQQVLDIIDNISNKLANKFKFGYHDTADIKQQVYIEILKPDKNGLNILDKYDETRPLANFLWSHIHNRLFNFKRNNYARPDRPCEKCPLDAYINNQCTAYKDMMECEFYNKWYNRNQTKKDLTSTKNYLEEHKATKSLPLEDLFFSKQVFNIVEKNIQHNQRQDWVRFCNKSKLNKKRREALIETILEILLKYKIIKPSQVEEKEKGKTEDEKI
jgi:uncharacterized protein YejL (UPF0352 family)